MSRESIPISPGRGSNYFKPKSEKEMPASLLRGELKLTEKLPAGVKTVYLKHKPLSKLGVVDACSFTRMGLQGGFARLSGNVVRYLDPGRASSRI